MKDDGVLFVTQFRKRNGEWQRRRLRKDTQTWLPWMTLHVETVYRKHKEPRQVWRWRKKETK